MVRNPRGSSIVCPLLEVATPENKLFHSKRPSICKKERTRCGSPPHAGIEVSVNRIDFCHDGEKSCFQTSNIQMKNKKNYSVPRRFLRWSSHFFSGNPHSHDTIRISPSSMVALYGFVRVFFVRLCLSPLRQTLQALGVMGCYRDSWPLLIVAPASMRLM